MMRLGLISRVALTFAFSVAVASCARAAEVPAAEERFVEELAEMVFGDREAVEVQIGYPIVQTSIIDGLDRNDGGLRDGFDPSSFVQAFEQLDAAYTQFVFDVRPRPVNAGPIGEAMGTERTRLADRTSFATVQADPPGGNPARNASALAIITYASAPGPEVREALAELHGRRRPTSVQIRPGCELFQGVEPATGYVDSLVLTLADPAGTLDLADENIFLCVFAAHLFNIGFADAVRTGRFASFPVDRSRSCTRAEAGDAPQERSPCRLLIMRRAHFAIAAELVRSGRLRPGRLERRAFLDAARETVAKIGWPTIVAINDFEALSARLLQQGPQPRPVARQ